MVLKVSTLMSSLLVASKYLDDFYCMNTYFASLGGISVENLNDLELKICFLLNFDLSVSKEEFDSTFSKLTLGMLTSSRRLMFRVCSPIFTILLDGSVVHTGYYFVW